MIINGDLIEVHGREGLSLSYTRAALDEDGSINDVDISGSDIFFEVEASNIRVRLSLDADNPLGLRIRMTREQVELIPLRATEFAVIDGTGDVPMVEWRGKISRVGFKGEPE